MFKSIQQILSNGKTLLIRKPLAEFNRLVGWGPRAYFRSEAWKLQMEDAAYRLPKHQQATLDEIPLEVWFLTGSRFWYQTAFCAWSLEQNVGCQLVVNLVDDGTLMPHQEEELRRLFPNGITRWKTEVVDQLQELLPHEHFPVLRKRWKDYINIRKLTDIHLGRCGPQLVLDSDMLFFDRPEELLAWWHNPVGICLMSDCEESYGYSRQLMEELTGAVIPQLLNVGVCGLLSGAIDWNELEHWARILVEREGTSYYLEQALVAMLASRGRPNVLPRSRYLTFPSREQTISGAGALQHYVSDSKPWYFGHAWRQFVPNS